MEKGLIKGIRVLELLAAAEVPLGVTEIAEQLGLGKSAVHRPLSTLTNLGYVRHDEKTGRYSASLKMWEVGTQVLARLDLKRVAAGPMSSLANATLETVHLSVFDKGEVVHIDKIECKHPIRAYSRVGGRVPSYCIATGKAMLAFQSESVIESVAANLKPVTPQTTVDRDQLLKELATVRRRGFAASKGGWQEGVNGIAAPVRDATGAVVAAIGISGPADRFGREQSKPYAGLVQEAAQDISAALGCSEHTLPQRDCEQGAPGGGKATGTSSHVPI